MRLYKTGSKWALWRWTFVPTGHLVRLHLVKTPWWSIYLHWILAPDPQPDPHNHPVWFLSLVLRGGYEHWLGEYWIVGETVKWGRVFTPQTIHRIFGVNPKTLTLCFAWHPEGSTQWGFFTRDGFVPWQQYNAVGGLPHRESDKLG